MQEAFDPNMGAAVPFTVVILPNGDVVYQEEGAVTLLALRRAILENLPDPRNTPACPMIVTLSAWWSIGIRNSRIGYRSFAILKRNEQVNDRESKQVHGSAREEQRRVELGIVLQHAACDLGEEDS